MFFIKTDEDIAFVYIGRIYCDIWNCSLLQCNFFISIFYLKIHVSVIDKFTCIKLFRSSFSTEDVAVNALFLFLYKYFSVTFSQKRHGRFQWNFYISLRENLVVRFRISCFRLCLFFPQNYESKLLNCKRL